MDELAQLIIFIVIALVAMLGSAKKKPQQRQPPRPVRRPPVPRRPTGVPPSVDTSRERLKEDLLDLLQGRVPSPPRRPPAPPPLPVPEPDRSIEFPPEEEARSIESLEPEGSASHAAFHEKYVEAPQPASEVRRALVRRLTPRTAREAVIWKTIFDKPKGME